MGQVYLIAEAGISHDGEEEKFWECLDVAKWAGADAVKFQYWSDPIALLNQRNGIGGEIYTRYQTPADWIERAFQQERDIDILCTVYLKQDIPWIKHLNPRYCKVGSWEAVLPGLLEAYYGYPTLVSTGKIPDIKLLEDREREEFEFLYCVSTYPASPEEIEPGELGDGYHSGFSDHTRNEIMGALAHILGADILEVHFRLDSTDPYNPDWCVSHSPDGLKRYIENVRWAERLSDSSR